MSVLGLAKMYKCRPSTLFSLTDAYTAYCLDEACAYIRIKMENGEEPSFKKEYKSFKDLYAKYS